MSDSEERSIEDDLRLAIESMNADEPAAEVADAEIPDGQPRGADGKFASTAEEPESAPETPATEAPAAEPEPEAIAPDPYGLAPATWTKEEKATWSEIPANVRAAITRREKDAHQLATRFDGERQLGKQIKDIVAPFEPLIRSLGADPVQAIDYLLKADSTLRTASLPQRREMLLKVARDYGINDLGDPGAMGELQPQIDPQIETLQQRIQRLEAEQNSASMRVKETEEQDIQSRIEAFAADPANVYFERVSPIMASFLSSGQAESLAQAYDMAVYADPETRALHLAAHTAEQERKRTQDATAKAAAARNASVSVTGAPGIAVPAQSSNAAASLEDDIRSAISMVNGRA